MKLIAITGSIGCGKTTIAKIIKALGYSVFDVDGWVRALYFQKDFIATIVKNFPEAADGGDIALIRDGDFINIDIPNRTINLEISDAELSERRNEMLAKGDMAYKPVCDRIVPKSLQFYAKSVSSAADGAVRKL